MAPNDEKIREVLKKLQQLTSDFIEFRKTSEEIMRRLMWTIDTVRNFVLQANLKNLDDAKLFDEKYRELHKDLLNRLRQ